MRKNNIYVIFILLNLIFTFILFVIFNKNYSNEFMKLLLISGVPCIISIIVFFLLQYALENENYTLIAGYNDEKVYNKKELRNIILFIQGYVTIISFICSFIFFILSFYKKFVWLYKYILLVYLFNFFIGIIYINIKKKKNLYIN